VGPLPSAKNKWHIHNALDAKITAGLYHNGERGFHIHVLWLYNSSISPYKKSLGRIFGAATPPGALVLKMAAT
jgi:hypothetical protein